MPESTLSAVSLPPKEAIAYLRQKANVTSEHWTDLWQEAHSRAFTVAGATTEALVSDFRAEVDKALAQGTTLAEFRKGFDAIVKKHGWEHTGTPGWRAEIIYQTNLSMAYSAGRYKRMSDPDVLEAYPYWRYQHNYAAHPRLQHIAWDGLTLPATDSWWATHWPPNGWRCHCSAEPVSARMLAREGRGLDQPPPIETRAWRNPKTGETLHVPVGIDPGFGYNPGQAWLDGESGARVGRGESPARRPMPPAQSIPAPEPASPAEARRVQADHIQSWLDAPHGSVSVGKLPEAARAELGAQSDEVLLSEETMQKQAEHHPELGDEVYRALPELLAHPLVIAKSRARHVVLISQAGQLYVVVLKTTLDGRENYVVSTHRVDRKEALRKLRRKEILFGDLASLDNQ